MEGALPQVGWGRGGAKTGGGAGWGGRGPEIMEHKNSRAFYESPAPTGVCVHSSHGL